MTRSSSGNVISAAGEEGGSGVARVVEGATDVVVAEDVAASLDVTVGSAVLCVEVVLSVASVQALAIDASITIARADFLIWCIVDGILRTALPLERRHRVVADSRHFEEGKASLL